MSEDTPGSVPAPGQAAAPGGGHGDDREQDRLEDLGPLGMLLARGLPMGLRQRLRDLSRQDRLGRSENLARTRAGWFIQTGQCGVGAVGAGIPALVVFAPFGYGGGHGRSGRETRPDGAEPGRLDGGLPHPTRRRRGAPRRGSLLGEGPWCCRTVGEQRRSRGDRGSGQRGCARICGVGGVPGNARRGVDLDLVRPSRRRQSAPSSRFSALQPSRCFRAPGAAFAPAGAEAELEAAARSRRQASQTRRRTPPRRRSRAASESRRRPGERGS